MCSTLAKACASTGMIAAMHHLQVLTLVRHGEDSGYFQAFLQQAADRQWLVASATSEVGATDIGTSIAALSPVGDRFRLDKQVATMSYGEQADAVLITARRTPRSGPSDQAFALVLRDSCRLEKRGQWNTLGMRGTCSPPFALSAEIEADQLLPAPAPLIIRGTLAPLAHVLWSAVWLGIAEAAKEKAHALARSRAERDPDHAPARDAGLVDAIAKLHMLRSSVAAAAADFPPRGAGEAGPTAAEMIRYATLKVSSSELAVSICTQCLLASGMAAYSNASPYSIGRHLRDVLSAPVMIANERLLAGTAAYLLVCPPAAS
jgi:acyl-CoA dehydrogenase